MSVTHKEQKFIKSLQSKKGRNQSSRFIAEGVRLIEEAVNHKLYPESVYFTENMLSERGRALLRKIRNSQTIIKSVSDSEMELLSQTEAPQGIIAIFRTPDKKLVELYWPKHRKLLLCDNISDPGNLGTLIRSAAAFEFDLVILCGNCAEPYSPKVVRSTAGGIFVPVIVQGEIDEILAFAAAEKMLIIAADLKGQPDKLPSNIRKRKIMLAIGSESEGLSKEFIEKAQVRLRIEHSRKVESLNAGVAGSILMSRLYKL